MTSSAHEFIKEDSSMQSDAEFRRIIQVYNQKLIREKLDRYSLDFVQLDSQDCKIRVHVVEVKETAAKSSNDSEFSREVPQQVENIYRTRLLSEFRKRKTFLKEVKIK